MLSISHILPRARAMYADRLAVWDGELRLTFEQLGRRVDALAGALKAQGVGRNDRVAILDVNSHQYAEAYYACAQAGMVLVPLNSRLAAPELKYILNDAGAKALLVSEPFFQTFDGLARQPVDDRDGAGLRQAALSRNRRWTTRRCWPKPNPTRPAPRRIPATSAKSITPAARRASPKGVCLTYQNMIASALDAIVGLGLTDRDVWLHGAPMFHLVDAWSIWSMPLIGAPQVTLHFTPEGIMQVVQRTKATGAGLPPTLINLMANHPKIGSYDLSSLRFIMYGGSPAPLGILQKAAKTIPTTYIHGYGITETSGITTLAIPRISASRARKSASR